MNHVKKMILVPHESVARMNDPMPSTAQIQTSSLDAEMDLIMKQKYASDDEKWKHYNDALQRYLFFTKERHKPLQISVENFTESHESEELIRQQLETALPKSYKASALRIFDYLSQADSKVTWDSTGTVSINKQTVPNSNIIDLISDLTRARKNFEPVGVSPFIKALAAINIPLELIQNSNRRADIISARTQSGSGIRPVLTSSVTTFNKVKTPKGLLVKQNKTQKQVKRNAWKSW